MCNSRHGDRWRARQDCQKQQTLFLLFWVFGGRSELSHMLLSTSLTTVFTLWSTGTSYGLDWTWFCDFELNFGKMSKNVDFSETRFSQGKGVGLRLYIEYMISKNSCDWFHWVSTCFALKMELLWKSDKERRTLWF